MAKPTRRKLKCLIGVIGPITGGIVCVYGPAGLSAILRAFGIKQDPILGVVDVEMIMDAIPTIDDS